MLNKPYAENGTPDAADKERLRIHRHTIPVCIPLAALALKYLPPPPSPSTPDKSKPQKLQAFVRALRREIVGYRNRIEAIKRLRRDFSLDETKAASRKGKEKDRERIIADVAAADAEARQIRIVWVDGTVARVLAGEKGEVVRAVVVGEVGDRGVDGVGRRIMDGVY